jgi:uncharacterized repeat protein (TIGR03803 family)
LPSLFHGNVGLIVDREGNVLGTTASSTVAELPAGGHAFTTLATFAPVSGAVAQGLILDATGSLYVATFGGMAGDGAVFQPVSLTPSAPPTSAPSGVTTVVDFPKSGLVNLPASGATVSVFDAAGNLYGTTFFGGANGDGTVFELAAGSQTLTTLAVFDGGDGVEPNSLVFDAAGNLYGTTNQGGPNSAGTVFELAAGSDNVTTLASFDGSNGSQPTALAIDAAGNLYGTAEQSGPNSDGTLFELATGSRALTTLNSFNGADGSNPTALVRDTAGNIFGTTFEGGATNGDGTVFELVAGSATLTTLAAFEGADGSNPTALVLDVAGNRVHSQNRFTLQCA